MNKIKMTLLVAASCIGLATATTYPKQKSNLSIVMNKNGSETVSISNGAAVLFILSPTTCGVTSNPICTPLITDEADVIVDGVHYFPYDQDRHEFPSYDRNGVYNYYPESEWTFLIIDTSGKVRFMSTNLTREECEEKKKIYITNESIASQSNPYDATSIPAYTIDTVVCFE